MKLIGKRKQYKWINFLFKTIYRKKSAFGKAECLQKKKVFHKIGEHVAWRGYLQTLSLYLLAIM